MCTLRSERRPRRARSGLRLALLLAAGCSPPTTAQDASTDTGAWGDALESDRAAPVDSSTEQDVSIDGAAVSADVSSDASSTPDADTPDTSPLDARSTDARAADASTLDVATDAGPAPRPIYYPVQRHTVVQEVTMMPLQPMVAIVGASYAVAPALPPGLSIDRATGAISGRPTAVSAVTNYRVMATAPSGSYARTLAIEVRTGAPSDLAYTTPSPTYARGTAIATNAPAYVGSRATFSVSPALPAGLSLSASTGYVTGTPTGTVGTTTHRVTATNSFGATSRDLRISVSATAPSPLVVAELVASDSAPSLMHPGIHDAGPPLVTTGIQAPFPWFADPCDLGSFGLTADRAGLRTRIQDGCRWHQNYTTYYNYARVELAVIRTLGGSSFPAGVASTIEWRGYFTTPLPADGRRDSLVAPFQLHNNNGGSPMYAIAVNRATRSLVLDVHRPDGSFERSIPIAPFASFLSTPRTLRFTIVPSNTATGRVSLELDGVVVHSANNIITSATAGEDYVKFGLYDYGQAVVDPAQPERGRTFEMVTEVFRLTR